MPRLKPGQSHQLWRAQIRNISAAVFHAYGQEWRLGDRSAPTIVTGSRLRKSPGSFCPATKTIYLHPRLIDTSRTLLHEVLVHELAHFVIYERYGNSVKPHGPEWQALVTLAGFTPHTRILWTDSLPPPSSSLATKVRYRHSCPVCHTTRTAARPQHRWRCAACVDAGLDGALTIESYISNHKDNR
ncbi:MAG: SprT-like domain-containing protein [bacterium]|nr:SprT-like domain-containing protein [bacterium]